MLSAVAWSTTADAAAPLPAAYSVKQTWTLEGAGRWDYLAIDTVRNRLFLTRQDHVDVLDLQTGRLIGRIADTPGVHGIAFAQELRRGFSSNGKSGTVTVFDLDTFKKIQEVKTSGANPDAILYETKSRKLYTFNGKSNNASIFDAATMTLQATITLNGKPEFAVSDERRIFVNIEDRNEVAVIDIASNQLTAQWGMAGCEGPSGMALDARHASLFSVCDNGALLVTDSRDGQQIARTEIARHPDAVIYDADSGNVFSSSADGIMSVVHQIDGRYYMPATAVDTAKGAKTMTMDYTSKRIFLPALIDKKFTVLIASPDPR